MTNTEFNEWVNADLCRMMGKGDTYTLTLNGVKVYVTGHYYAGCGIGYSRHGEAIQPPEPASFEISGLYANGVDILPIFGEGGEDLIARIEQKVVEQVQA